MKNKFELFSIFMASSLFLICFGCKKDNNNSNGILFNPNLTYGTVTDIDGIVYKTITIINQTWMAENLKVIHYRNGDSLTNVTENAGWKTLNYGAYCDYNNTPGNSAIYGKLYNWFAVHDSRNIAPIGWHVPTKAELEILNDHLGGEIISGSKLKETGTSHWLSPNSGATNESGFTAVPGGWRDVSGIYYNINEVVHLWTATESNEKRAWSNILSYDNPGFYKDDHTLKVSGFSVRCVKDN
jgi:uncharacterized protein (TIGR02145 family)